MQSAIKVVVGDGHRCTLSGLRALIDAERPRMEVVAAEWRAADVIAAVRRHQPDIVVLELEMEGEPSFRLFASIQNHSAAKILVLTGSREPEGHEHAVLSGAQGVILKSEPSEMIVKAIERVHAGELWLKRELVARLIGHMRAGRPTMPSASETASAETLTPTEMRVVAAAVHFREAPNKIIAERLHISAHTLRNHLSAIYTKLGIHRRVDLILFGIRIGLDIVDTGVLTAGPSGSPLTVRQQASRMAAGEHLQLRHRALAGLAG